MSEKVKYQKRFYNKETGDYELSKARFQVRDFGATRMTLQELEDGVKRATKRIKRCTELGGVYLKKVGMYQEQVKVYTDRVVWYTK